MAKLLCLCDSPTAQTGFARVAQNLLKRWTGRFERIDVWGINYHGYPHTLPYRIYPATFGNVSWSHVTRMQALLNHIIAGDYTHLWMMQDLFQLQMHEFPEQLMRVCRQKRIRTLLYFPVDASLDPKWMTPVEYVDVPVAYTQYGKRQAEAAIREKTAEEQRGKGAEEKGDRAAGVEDVSATAPAPVNLPNIRVIPHGVDTAIYHPVEGGRSMRKQVFTDWKDLSDSDFLMVNVNANQRRKDVFRCFEILKALRDKGMPAKLYMHMPSVAVHDETKLHEVAKQLGLRDRHEWMCADTIFERDKPKAPEPFLNTIYNLADLYLTTTLGEGWGLGITEAMGAGCPVAAPLHTACEEILNAMPAEVEQMLLPVDPSITVLWADNHRLRHRMDVAGAASRITARYVDWQLTPPKRGPLPAEIKSWLNWDRIAVEWLELMF